MRQYILNLLLIVTLGAVAIPVYAQDSDQKYQLTILVNPENSGVKTGNTYWGQPSPMLPGETITLDADSAYNHNNLGFRFVSWTIDGATLSSQAKYKYEMPARDVMVTCNYVFDPVNPSHPDQPVIGHWLTTKAEPKGTGSFSYDKRYLYPGEKVGISPYPKRGFRFVGWRVNGGDLIASDGSSYELVMGDDHVELTGVFEFDPTAPASPGANMWNPSTGQMIVNDFTPGSLSSAISDLLDAAKSENKDLKSLTVIGQLRSYDWGTCVNYRYSGLEILDVHRTDLQEIGWGGMSGTKVNVVSLPATLSAIGDEAFRECDNLTTINLYATVPPKVGENTFSNFPQKDFCVLRVPPESIPLYEAADVWRDFYILPIEDDVRQLQVSLPDDFGDGRYVSFRIELEDISLGTRQKYVVTDRQRYVFPNLPDNSMYNIYLYNPKGMEVARIANVLVAGADVNAQFDNIKQMCQPAVVVTTSDGENVADQCVIRWSEVCPDGSLSFIHEGARISDIPEGTRLLCTVDLGPDLGIRFVCPQDVRLTATPEMSPTEIRLDDLRTLTISGRICDTSGMPVNPASVVVSCLCNCKYPCSSAASVDALGNWSLTIYEATEYKVTYSASDYVTLQDTVVMKEYTRDLDFGTAKLKGIEGAKIHYHFSYTNAAKGGETPEVVSTYSDYANVVLSVYNVTRECELHNVSQQYPYLVVLDDAAQAGDVLRVTARSTKGGFDDIVTQVTLDGNLCADVEINIVGRGGIESMFNMTEYPRVTSILYDAAGNMVQAFSHANTMASFSDLASGDYTLVTMGALDFSKTLVRLSVLDEMGLVAGMDYLRNDVKVKSGLISEVRNDVVPVIDEDKFSYVVSGSRLSLNKATVTAGQNLTVKCEADIKAAYKDKVRDLKLIFNLPEGAEMVANSLMKGRQLVDYDLQPGQVIVPLSGDYGEDVRFVVSSSRDGQACFSAAYSFVIDGVSMVQPIGSATTLVENLAITVPDEVNTPDFAVSGMALAGANVKIYDRNDLVGETTAKSNGTWTVKCNLVNPKNNSAHDIQAVVTDTKGKTLRSETKRIIYDAQAVVLSRITMTNNNYMNHEQVVVFDYLNEMTGTQKYE